MIAMPNFCGLVVLKQKVRTKGVYNVMYNDTRIYFSVSTRAVATPGENVL